MKIDFVFPYVDCYEPTWRNSYFENFGNAIEIQRFRDFGTLPYLLRGLDKNAPWLNNVFILVATKEQAPKFLSDKVKVITHGQFIPEQYLPCFNSNTIEMFLQNIPGLEEHFIYGNDDTFINSPLKPTDFFSEAGTPRGFYKHFFSVSSPFQKLCYRSYNLIAKENTEHYIKPDHFLTSQLKSAIIKSYKEYETQIKSSLTIKRDLSRNLNQYFFIYYNILHNNFELSDNINFKYHSTADNIEEIIKTISSGMSFCLNDNRKPDNFNLVLDALQKKYPTKSIYEK